MLRHVLDLKKNLVSLVVLDNGNWFKYKVVRVNKDELVTMKEKMISINLYMLSDAILIEVDKHSSSFMSDLDVSLIRFLLVVHIG